MKKINMGIPLLRHHGWATAALNILKMDTCSSDWNICQSEGFMVALPVFTTKSNYDL